MCNNAKGMERNGFRLRFAFVSNLNLYIPRNDNSSKYVKQILVITATMKISKCRKILGYQLGVGKIQKFVHFGEVPDPFLTRKNETFRRQIFAWW